MGEEPVIFLELMAAADRAAGIEDQIALPMELAPRASQPLPPRHQPVYEDDLLTLKRAVCVIEDRVSVSEPRKVRLRPAPPPAEDLELPLETRIPRYDWQRELRSILTELGSSKERETELGPLKTLPAVYHSSAREDRLRDRIARTCFNDEYIDPHEIFGQRSADEVELIECQYESHPSTTEGKDRKTKESTRNKTSAVHTKHIGFKNSSKGAIKRNVDDSIIANRNRRLLTSVANHAVATSHRNTKPDLTIPELKNFHRPRMSASLKSRPWSIHVAGEKSTRSSANRAINLHSSAVDLNIAAGEFILVEYIEEYPPLMLNFGMSSLIVNYERIRDVEMDQDERRHKSMQKSVNIENAYRLPRHVRLLMEKKDFKQIFEIDSSTKLTVGEPFILEAYDEFPFLGTLEPGEIVQSFKNELFRSPLFPHSPRSTDFVLVRTKIGKDALQYTLRPIRQLFLSGQLEPLEVVPKPTKGLNKTQECFFLLAAARYLLSNRNGVEWSDLRKELIRSSFSKEKALESILSRIAYRNFFEVDAGSRTRISRWFPNKELDPDELEKMFTAKDVCLQESAAAAEYRLTTLGLEQMDMNKLSQWLSLNTDLFKSKKERAIKVFLFAERSKEPKLRAALQKIKRITVKELRDLEQRIEVGKFIRRYLLSCPWNTTEAFKDRVCEIFVFLVTINATEEFSCYGREGSQ